MSSIQISPSAWARLSGISGILGVVFYFIAAFVPFLDMLSRLLAFAFGPLVIVSFIGLYRFLAEYKNRIALEIALVFGIIAGTILTTMLVVQIGNNMLRADLLATAGGEVAKESIKVSWGAVNRDNTSWMSCGISLLPSRLYCLAMHSFIMPVSARSGVSAGY